LLAIAAIAAPAHAQIFPNKTIRIIVPYPVGGSIVAHFSNLLPGH